MASIIYHNYQVKDPKEVRMNARFLLSSEFRMLCNHDQVPPKVQSLDLGKYPINKRLHLTKFAELVWEELGFLVKSSESCILVILLPTALLFQK